MYSDKDIELIKSVFAENDFLLIAVRKLFFGGELTSDEKKAITDTFRNKEVIEVFRRKVYSSENFDTPIGQVSDIWLGAEEQVFGATRDTIYQTVHSKAAVKSMFETAFKLLENIDGEKVSISYDPMSTAYDELAVGLIARNLYIKAIETALFSLKTIAGMKDEKLEDTLKRLKQDSSK